MGHKEDAQRHREAAAESFERCDTDGALSQWGHTMNAELSDLRAQIESDGGRAQFRALFDLAGNLVPARPVETRHGRRWVIERPDADDEWFGESQARDWVDANRRNALKGYYLGTVMAPAHAAHVGGGKGLAGAANVRAVAVPNERDYWRDCIPLDTGAVSTPYYLVWDRVEQMTSRHEARTTDVVNETTDREFARRLKLGGVES